MTGNCNPRCQSFTLVSSLLILQYPGQEREADAHRSSRGRAIETCKIMPTTGHPRTQSKKALQRKAMQLRQPEWEVFYVEKWLCIAVALILI